MIGNNIKYTSHYASPLGPIIMASDGEALCGLWFDGQKHIPDKVLNDTKKKPDIPIFHDTRRWLDIYFSGNAPDFTPHVRLNASEFRMRVWQILLTIPYAQTTTYGHIASIIAQERAIRSVSAQAVGNAVGHNPVSIIIPCHRVLGAHNSLTGYAAGIDKKIELLKLENPAFQL